MIELKVEDYCHRNCDRFEPVAHTDSTTLYEGAKPVEKVVWTTVECENASMCRAIYKDFEKKFGKEA